MWSLRQRQSDLEQRHLPEEMRRRGPRLHPGKPTYRQQKLSGHSVSTSTLGDLAGQQESKPWLLF